MRVFRVSITGLRGGVFFYDVHARLNVRGQGG